MTNRQIDQVTPEAWAKQRRLQNLQSEAS
jgi:hypothetical protein